MSNKKIAGSAVTVSLITTLSRILGYIRDAMSAAIFGVGAVSDAFFVAFRIPNLLRNLLAEGSLSSAFIPVFTDYVENRKKKDIWRLAANVVNILAAILLGVTLLGIILAPVLVGIMAPGFIDEPEKFKLTVSLTRYLFPFIFLVSIAALFLGILNSLKMFSVPAFAPVVLNVVMIASGLWICPRFGTAPDKQVYGWVIGTLLGALAQIVIQWIPAAKKGFQWKPIFDFADKGIKRIGKLMVPATLAQSVTQINLLVNTILASFLVQGAVTYLYYGNRLMQLPLGVFGIAIATVSFPYISSYAAKGDKKNLRLTIHSSLKQAFFIIIPSALGIIFLSRPINVLLFNYGRFTLQDSIATANVCIMYSFAIFAYSGIKILSQVYYAIDKASTSVKISVFSMALNIVLCVALMFKLNYLGLALATSITAVVQFGVLYYYVEKFVGNIKTKELIFFSLKIIAASLIMGLMVYSLSEYLTNLWNSGYVKRSMNAVIVLISMVTGTAIYFALLPVFQVDEMKSFFKTINKKIGEKFGR